MSRNQHWSIWRQNKGKNTFQVSSLLDIPYIHRKLSETLALCRAEVIRVCFSFLRTNKRLKKLETCQVGKIAQLHQHMLNPLIEELKVGAIFHA